METKSRFSIDLRHLSDNARSLLPASLRGNQPNISSAFEPPGLPTAATMSLEVPADFGCNPIECGTSVFAAGCAALELARAQMAKAGIARSELDQIGPAQVSLEQVAIPFVFQFAKIGETKLFAKALDQRARLLGLEICHDKACNTMIYREKATDASASNGLAIRVLPWPLQKLTRIDVVLNKVYLETQCLTALDRWRNAYLENRYERIFNERVRRLFRLGGNVPFMPPSEHVYDQLSPLAAELLRICVDRKDPTTHPRFGTSSGIRDSRKKRTIKELSERVLAVSGINISFQWKNEFLPPTLLVSQLVYPGDFDPEDFDSGERDCSKFFCKQNWPTLLAELHNNLHLRLIKE